MFYLLLFKRQGRERSHTRCCSTIIAIGIECSPVSRGGRLFSEGARGRSRGGLGEHGGEEAQGCNGEEDELLRVHGYCVALGDL